IQVKVMNVFAHEECDGMIDLARPPKRLACRWNLCLIENAKAGPSLFLFQEPVLDAEPCVAESALRLSGIVQAKEIAGGPVQIEVGRDSEAEAACYIVAVHIVTQPLALQAIFHFDDPALRGIGSAGNRGPAGDRYDRGIGACFRPARGLGSC